MTEEEILLACPLFEGMTEEELEAMLGCLSAREAGYARGEVILAEGEPAKRVGVVLSGRVQLSRTDHRGNRSLLGSLEAGQIFGEAFACAQAGAMPLTVSAAEESRVMLMDIGRMMTTCAQACAFHRRMVFNLLRLVARKNLQLQGQAQILSHRTTREKLMAYLEQQAALAGSSSFTVPYDRQELADYLAVDRSGLSAQISQLREEGVLECSRNRFRLL